MAELQVRFSHHDEGRIIVVAMNSLRLLFVGDKLCDRWIDLIIFLMRWDEHIASDPNILRGMPCIKGTRIPVALILGYLAAERTRDEILREFPALTVDDISACLDYARAKEFLQRDLFIGLSGAKQS